MTKKLCPSLGFPDEEWDEDGDYACRPTPDLVASVLVTDGPTYWVALHRYEADRPINRHYVCPSLGGETEADCPLQAMGAIFHLVNTNLNNGGPQDG